MSKDIVEFQLTQPISYSSKGEHKEGLLLFLRAPTIQENSLRLKLKQYFFRAVMTGADGNAEAQDDEFTDPTPEEVVMLMNASQVDMTEVMKDFQQLIISGNVCMVEDEVKLTKSLSDKIDLEDLDLMLGAYLSNFIVASALKTLLENSNKPVSG